MKLTVKSINAAHPKAAAYKLTDGCGLYLYITPVGTKVWRANYKDDGKQKTITYGRYPEIGLAQARHMNLERKLFVEEKKVAVPTFKEMTERWLLVKLPSLSSESHKHQVSSTLHNFVIPFIGDKRMDEIKRFELVTAIQKMVHIPESAHRVAGRICAVFDYAQDCGVLESHPARRLTRVLPSRKTKIPRRSISTDGDEVKKLLTAIDTYSEPITKLALKLMAYTFVRTKELIGMKWSEVDFDNMVWVVPENRMKLRMPHVVPLTPQTVAILYELKKYETESGLVIESMVRPGHPLSGNTLLFALYRLGYRGVMTVHGFRALASTILNQQPQFSADAIERQLAHSETNMVRAAYHRAQYLPHRREIMAWWSDWLDQQYTG
ncbi:tyrosine-type recombinase/integrase [Undibacterium sp. Ji42W]|uniref:tyrosine-type recombinase/integrase n=1 Tax=Undibacterium sp. Ji42W TaxID=3413039 RepID=UPI003BF1D1C3